MRVARPVAGRGRFQCSNLWSGDDVDPGYARSREPEELRPVRLDLLAVVPGTAGFEPEYT